MNLRRAFFGGLVYLACAAPVLPQVSTRIIAISPAETRAGTPLHLVAELQESATITGMTLAYRPFGESQYRVLEMDIVGNRAAITLPPDAIRPPFIEYYIVIRLQSGSLDVYPQSEGPDPLNNPPGTTRRLMVRDVQVDEPQITFLSPEPLAFLLPEDVVISVSLLRVDSLVERTSTRVLLDGTDITANAVLTGDLIVYVPGNTGTPLTPGIHVATVLLFDRSGNQYKTGSMQFTVIGEGQETPSVSPSTPLFASGSVNIESRRENIGGGTQWYNRGGLQFRGTYGDIRTVGNLFLTSDEKSNRQPQNRYFLSVEVPWLKVEAGDAYPTFPDLILSGKRVRGVNSSLHLGLFNIDATYGTVSRAIEGTQIKVFPIDRLSAEQALDPSAAYAQVGPTLWGKGVPGTYSRTLLAVRPSLGSGETWQLGFTWLNAKDDLSSIRYGVRPKENIVLGSDLTIRMDNGHIELGFQGAFSAFNTDISSGSFTDAYIDTVYPDNADQIKQLRDALGKYITVNDNFRPLALEYPATAAAEGRLALDYFGNYVRVNYLYRGADYTSFGQTYLRTDVQGFNLSDRLRLLDNSVFATIGVERLTDNTARTKPSTTVFSNVNAAVTYYSTQGFPSLTLGYARFRNDNGISPDSLLAIDDITNRLYLQSSYNFEWGTSQTILLNLSSSGRTDYTRHKQNVNNFMAVLGLTTRYAIPLQTDVSLGLNLNELPGSAPDSSSRLDYTSISLSGRYSFIPNTLTVTGTLAPTFGDFNRTIFDLRTEWAFMEPMMLIFQISYFRNDGIPNDSFVSLRYLYAF
jgi:hypothetical protein